MTSHRTRSARSLAYVSMVLVALAVTLLAPSAQAQVGDVPGAVDDAVGGATDTVKDTVGGTTDTVKETVGGTTDTVKDTTGGATDTVKDTVGGAVGGTTDTVGGVVGGTTDTVGGVVGDTTDTVGGAVDDTTEAVGGVAEEGVSPATGTGLSSGITDFTGRTSSGGTDGDGTLGAAPGTTVITLPDGTRVVVPTLEGSVDGRKVLAPNLSSEAAEALRGLVDGFAGATSGGTSMASFAGGEATPSRSFLDDASRFATEAAKALAFPLALAGLVLAFLAIQGRIGRKDPKLAAAPVHAEETSLTFQ